MDSDLIRPDETAYRLELTAAQLKIVHTALRSLWDDLGHEEHEVKAVVAAVLNKLPGEHEIRAIDLNRELHPRPGGALTGADSAATPPTSPAPGELAGSDSDERPVG